MKGSGYATGEYFNKYVENDFTPKRKKQTALFEGMHIPTKEDWAALKDFVAEKWHVP
ncbi:hypothetical protein ACEQPO_14370 [Bacillus sp. SL00103]